MTEVIEIEPRNLVQRSRVGSQRRELAEEEARRLPEYHSMKSHPQ
jgi:hypothetical protein